MCGGGIKWGMGHKVGHGNPQLLLQYSFINFQSLHSYIHD